ncbi:hypothetical protein R1sor_012981 [Riccia sorocarpa]|uniref:Uncharacterized protein n=1 Tax=Riccia sorocarpa TaxID=122646 RepID=A0ABD3I8Y4_9MARC
MGENQAYKAMQGAKIAEVTRKHLVRCLFIKVKRPPFVNGGCLKFQADGTLTMALFLCHSLGLLYLEKQDDVDAVMELAKTLNPKILLLYSTFVPLLVPVMNSQCSILEVRM